MKVAANRSVLRERLHALARAANGGKPIDVTGAWWERLWNDLEFVLENYAQKRNAKVLARVLLRWSKSWELRWKIRNRAFIRVVMHASVCVTSVCKAVGLTQCIAPASSLPAAA